MMEFPQGTILIAIGWGVSLLILWNLHHYGRAFGRKRFWTAASVATVLAAGSAALLLFKQNKHLAVDGDAVLLTPLFKETGEGLELNPAGFSFADRASSHLRSASTNQLRILPVESILETTEIDSIKSVAFLKTLAQAFELRYVGCGSFKQDEDSLRARFQLLAAGEVVAQKTFAVPKDDRHDLSAGIASLVLQHATGNVRVSPQRSFSPCSSSLEEEFYEAQMQLARNQTQPTISTFSKLALRDTSCHDFARLAVQSALRHLEQKQAKASEWEDSLRVLIPRMRFITRLDSNQAENHLLLGQCYVHAKKWREAETALRSALKLDPSLSKIYVNLAHLHGSRLGDLNFKNDLAFYRHGLALNPLDLEAVVNTAEAFMLENRVDDARELLEKYRRFAPNNLAILMSLGRLYINKGDIVAVLELYEHILKLDPDNADAYYNLGIAYYNQDDFDTALRFFERAILLANHADSRLYISYIHERRGEMEQAIRYLRERIALSSGDDDEFAGEARKHLYQILMARGEIPEHLLPDKLETK